MDRQALEAAAHAQSGLATLLLESVTARAQFLDRRLLWQFTTPIRARVASTLPGLNLLRGASLPTRPYDRRPTHPPGQLELEEFYRHKSIIAH